MAHFALVSLAQAGHVLPLGEVGRELVGRGHRVTLVAAATAAPLADDLAIPLHPLEVEAGRAPATPFFGPVFRLLGTRDVLDLFLRRTGALLDTLPGSLRDLEVDCVIVDQALPAAATAAEHAGLPFVTLCTSIPWIVDPEVPPVFVPWPHRKGPWARLGHRRAYAGWAFFFWPVLRQINRQRQEWGLAPYRRMSDGDSPILHLAQGAPEFDFPRRHLPPRFRYVGALTAGRTRPAKTSFPWERLDGRPLVYVSLGTMPSPRNAQVLRRILTACSGLDVQVVLGRGKWGGPCPPGEGPVGLDLGSIPENALVVDYAPQLALLDRARLAITHAGFNSTLEALSRGVPILGLPRCDDQPGVGARILRSGAGLIGSFHHSTSDELRALVRQLLSEPDFQGKARSMQAALAATGGVAQAAEWIEGAATAAKARAG